MYFLISIIIELHDNKTDSTIFDSSRFYREYWDIKNNNLILEGRSLSWLWRNALVLYLQDVWVSSFRASLTLWGSPCDYRKYEYSVDDGSSFNPLLFLGIVFLRCDLYDKIIPYVKILNILLLWEFMKKDIGIKNTWWTNISLLSPQSS